MPRGNWVLKSYFPGEGVSVSHRVSKTVKQSTILFARNYPISTVLNVECFFEVILSIYRFKMVASQIDKLSLLME